MKERWRLGSAKSGPNSLFCEDGVEEEGCSVCPCAWSKSVWVSPGVLVECAVYEMCGGVDGDDDDAG